MHARHSSPHRKALLAARAAQMRVRPTASERALFSAIGSSRLGVAFRRQTVIGEYVVDFVAPAAR
ncbi:MAG: DUF559 domain-containing protein, partial [Polyangiaceae bacterium]|nr:DUF559 domain-containing protein [Polyangiaceae bacterium]